MSAVVILVLCETVRFLVKDKSENTFIKYVMPRDNSLRHCKFKNYFANDNTLAGPCSDKIGKSPLAPCER